MGVTLYFMPPKAGLEHLKKTKTPKQNPTPFIPQEKQTKAKTNKQTKETKPKQALCFKVAFSDSVSLNSFWGIMFYSLKSYLYSAITFH